MVDIAVTLPSQPPDAQECPQCHTSLPVHTGYVTWCDSCGWNLQPLQSERPPNVFEKVYQSLGKRMNRRLLEEMCRSEVLRPKLTLAKLAVFALVLLVHALFLGLWGLLIWVVCDSSDLRLKAMAVVLVLYIAWQLRRRKFERPDGSVNRKDFPQLYQHADQIADALHAPKVDLIVIGRAFNAWVSQPGPWRKRVLYLGLPLLALEDGQERVALIAHELAHFVNGDPTRGFLVGSALDSLANWYSSVLPREIWPRGGGLLGLVMIPANLFMYAVAQIFWLMWMVLIHLSWRDSQRAEYLADYLSATVAGTSAAVGQLETLLYGDTFVLAVDRCWANRQIKSALAEFERLVAEVPPRELERRMRVDAMDAIRPDLTHPPLVSRIDFLKAHPVGVPRYVLSPADMEALDRELLTARRTIDSRLLGRSAGAGNEPRRGTVQ